MNWDNYSILYRLYRRPLTKAIILCLSVTVLTFCSYLLIAKVSPRFIGLYFFMSVLMSLTIVFLPLVFNHRDTTLMRQLPVGAGMKTVFYVVTVCVALPFLTQILWWGMCMAYSWLLHLPDLYTETLTVLLHNIPDKDYMKGLEDNWSFYMISGTLQMLVRTAIVLYIVMCTRPERRILRAVMVYIGICVLCGLAGVVVGVVIGFTDAMHALPMRTGDEVAMMVTNYVHEFMPVYILFELSVFSLCVYGIYRHLSRVK